MGTPQQLLREAREWFRSFLSLFPGKKEKSRKEEKFRVVWESGLVRYVVVSVTKPRQWRLETTDGRVYVYHIGDEIFSRLKPGDEVWINCFGEIRTWGYL